MKVLSILFIAVILNAGGSLTQDSSNLQSSEMNILPYIHVPIQHGTPYGNAPELYEFGLYGKNGVQAYNNLNGAYNGFGTIGLGYHNRFFGKHGLTKGIGSVGYGVANGFSGLYGTKGGYGDQFINGNSNNFAKEKVFSQNKNFGSGLKGGFGAGYGVQGGHHGKGGYNGFGSINQAATGGQGLYTADGQGIGGHGHHSLNLASLNGKNLGTTG